MSSNMDRVHELDEPELYHNEPAPINPLFVDRNRTFVRIEFNGLLTLREVYAQLASLHTLTDQLITIDYRRAEDY